jgi:hypothetical protein
LSAFHLLPGTFGVIEVGLDDADIPHEKGGAGAAIESLSESVSAQASASLFAAGFLVLILIQR